MSQFKRSAAMQARIDRSNAIKAQPPRTVYLVACSGTKATQATQARDLYLGDLFRKSRQYVEAMGASPGRRRSNDGAWCPDGAPVWFVLSAKHGLVEPDAVVEPYDQSMAGKAADRADWAERVMCHLPGLGKGDRVVLLAGRAYRAELSERLAVSGVVVEVPLYGLGIGSQRARLGQLIAATQPPQPAQLGLFGGRRGVASGVLKGCPTSTPARIAASLPNPPELLLRATGKGLACANCGTLAEGVTVAGAFVDVAGWAAAHVCPDDAPMINEMCAKCGEDDDITIVSGYHYFCMTCDYQWDPSTGEPVDPLAAVAGSAFVADEDPGHGGGAK